MRYLCLTCRRKSFQETLNEHVLLKVWVSATTTSREQAGAGEFQDSNHDPIFATHRA